MWWITSLAILVPVAFLAVLAARKTAADRRRSAAWNNLHERGKLIASQLAHLNKVEAREAPGVPRERSSGRSEAKKPRSFWPRRAAMKKGRSLSGFAVQEPIRAISSLLPRATSGVNHR